MVKSNARRLQGSAISRSLIGVNPACLTRPRHATDPSLVPLQLAKAPERDTFPDFWGPMVRFESDQKSDSPRERAVHSFRTPGVQPKM
jgi:hypothetical protein